MIQWLDFEHWRLPMERSLTLMGAGWRRFWSFIAGAGMIAASVLTIRHFFNANFPESIFLGSFCDISTFFNCDSSAYSSIAQVWGVPMGYFGLVVGALVVLGALFPAPGFERTNKSLSLLNALGVIGLFIYSVFFLKSLCLLCSGYYLFSLLSFALFWKYGLAAAGKAAGAGVRAFLSPSIKYLLVFAVAGLYLVLLERKVAAWFQLRLGPNRVGPFGLFQTMADALKLVSKEMYGTNRADKFLYNLAPYFPIITALLAMAVLPFSEQFQAFDINIGIFFLLAVSSVGVIGILLGGWASNNKYSLIGAMRSGLQVVSYELSVGLSLLTMVVLTGTLQVSEIIEVQKNGWLIVQGHIPAIIAFVIFMIAGTAETNRAPFDLVEAESELGAGFHTEYSGMKFAYFFLAEFINMFIISAIAVIVFFGGWLSPFGITEGISWFPSVLWFLGKVLVIVFLMMWFRWTFPRLRVDQLLNLEWKYLLPINLFNLVIMAVVVWLGWVITF